MRTYYGSECLFKDAKTESILNNVEIVEFFRRQLNLLRVERVHELPGTIAESLTNLAEKTEPTIPFSLKSVDNVSHWSHIKI